MRLDLFLFENGLASSRTEAKSFITEGAVRIKGEHVTKPSYSVEGISIDDVSIDRSVKPYVSRGGIKLLSALEAFSVDPRGRFAIDIGASSGGFTDCLLQHGASGVLAVDSGSGQLVDSLRTDPRVTVYENYNARYMKHFDFPYVPSLAVMDVSFISARMIIPSVYDVLAEGGDYLLLIKPQFEVGRAGLGKNGIVKDDKQRNAAVDGVIEVARSVGFSFCGLIKSPILGGDGNVEFLAHFKKERQSDV